MGFINLAERTVHAKLVYYGIGSGGKTTSLQAVHGIMCPSNEVKLVSINTEEDATLLFDFLPIDLGTVEGFKIVIQGFTVPGQPKYRRMRKYVLQGADAVVLVVDSQRSRLEENIEALEGLIENLRANGLDPDTIPIVIQYNKRDLSDIASEEEMDPHFLIRRDVLAFPSVATESQGVYETFVHCAGILVENKIRQYNLGQGSVDPAGIAESARQKLWSIFDEYRHVEEERAMSEVLEVTVEESGPMPEPEREPEADNNPKLEGQTSDPMGHQGGALGMRSGMDLDVPSQPETASPPKPESGSPGFGLDKWGTEWNSPPDDGDRGADRSGGKRSGLFSRVARTRSAGGGRQRPGAEPSEGAEDPGGGGARAGLSEWASRKRGESRVPAHLEPSETPADAPTAKSPGTADEITEVAAQRAAEPTGSPETPADTPSEIPSETPSETTAETTPTDTPEVSEGAKILGEIFSDAELEMEFHSMDPLDDEEYENGEEGLLDKALQSNLEMAAAYGKLDQYKAGLQRKNEELIEITQNSIHDLRKPLCAIKLMMNSAVKGYLGKLEDNVAAGMENALLGVSMMERLIDDLTDSMKFDTEFRMEFVEVDLAALVKEVVTTLHYLIEEKRVTVEVDELPIVRADSWALTKAFMNLVGNAIQYSSPDRAPQIHVGYEKRDTFHCISVADNGIGIPEGQHDRLFRRFERGSNAAGISGTGLGLHIIKETVMGHGGHLQLDSKEGEGTTFSLYLPEEPVAVPQTQIAEVVPIDG